MTSTPIARVVLARREQQIIEGLADGSTLPEIAQNLLIRQGTAEGYLHAAKKKLHGVSENAAALAVAYVTGTITRPDLLKPEELDVPSGQLVLVPLIAQGMFAPHIASKLKRPASVIRHDVRELMAALKAKIVPTWSPALGSTNF